MQSIKNRIWLLKQLKALIFGDTTEAGEKDEAEFLLSLCEEHNSRVEIPNQQSKAHRYYFTPTEKHPLRQMT